LDLEVTVGDEEDDESDDEYGMSEGKAPSLVRNLYY